jgi:outer membrane protein OmpA-like peptidoglycan-associated protein
MTNFYSKISFAAVVAILVMVCSFSAKAQYDFTMQGMTLVPQRMYINPAFVPDSKWHIGLPILSSNHITLGHSGFAYSQLIKKDGNDSLYVDLQSAIDKMGKKDYLSLNAKIDLLSFSFTFGPNANNFMYVNATLRMGMRGTLPRDLINSIWKGNGAYLGETIDLKKMNVDATVYTEWSLGYARKLLDKKLRVGIMLKYLNGITNVSTDNRGLSLYTDPNNFNLTAKADVTLNSAGLLGDFTNIGGDGISYKTFLTGNHGFAFNIGAHYLIDEHWEVAVSANDLGMIFWKENTNNMTIGDSEFTFQGLDLAQFLTQPDSANVFEEFVDTLEAAFPFTETENDYNTSLSSQIYISGAYKFTDRDRLGLDFYGEIYKTHFEPAVALNYTRKFGTIFHLSGSYMYNNQSFANFGFGFGLTLGPVQWYLAMDNVLAPVIPQHSQNAHFHSGLNFVVNYKDKKLKDRDGDGIIDKLDDCPDDFGLEVFAGCPDRDLDSIPDKTDNCPDEFGPKENSGCPWGDKDADGILDNVDECPDVPGPEENKGCPWGDSDGDGIKDNEDKCPDEAGPAENDGCPWGDRDADGIKDNEDRCPDVPGPADNEGCPYQDSDGDGVIDLEDNCPRTPGPIENKGCPVIEKEEQEVLNTAFQNLEFQIGSDIIAGSSYESLDELAALLVKKPEYRLKISGHTDNVGSAESNSRLSEKRSKSVSQYLKNKGVNTSKFVVEWFGESKPAYPNDTKEGRQKNRRVEMEVVFE